jgi:hypothetical protein
MKVRAAEFCFNRDPQRPNEVHLAMRDTKGRLWQRYSTMAEGVWGAIILPDEPPVEPRRARVAKPARRRP